MQKKAHLDRQPLVLYISRGEKERPNHNKNNGQGNLYRPHKGRSTGVVGVVRFKVKLGLGLIYVN